LKAHQKKNGSPEMKGNKSTTKISSPIPAKGTTGHRTT